MIINEHISLYCHIILLNSIQMCIAKFNTLYYVIFYVMFMVQSHTALLFQNGFRFHVLARHFIVHIGHQQSKWGVDQLQNAVEVARLLAEKNVVLP